MFAFLFNQIKLEEKEAIASEINLVIKDKGFQSLVKDSYYKEPFQVKVNGQIRDSCIKSCVLENEINNITLIFRGENKFMREYV